MKEKVTHPSDASTSTQRGQAIVLIAMGFVMLLAFTGLVVDVARVFVTRGELRRAVDAAGLAATAQFRQGATGQKIISAAYDLVSTHGVFSPTVTVETCNLSGTAINTALCTDPPRKLVRVTASAEVPMLFLQLVGINSVQIAGDNMSEAASVEAVLVLDNSESQAYNFASLPAPYNTKCNQTFINDIYACINGGTLTDGTTITGCNNETVADPNYPALTRGICQPFRKTKEAAYAFIRRLYEGYDRVAVINFNEIVYDAEIVHLTGNLTGGSGSAIEAINNMDVHVSPNKPTDPNPYGHILCNSDTAPSDFWKCGSSNIASGLIAANNEFGRLDGLGRPIVRQDALWVTLLLVDGAANRAPIISALTWSDTQYGVCPLSERSVPLKCRDADSNTRHKPDDIGPNFGLYDADDFARDYGDQLGLDPERFAGPLPGSKPDGVLIYTIALGKNSVCSNGTYTPPGPGPATCIGWNPVYGDPDAAEQLLRYIADIGDDGDPRTGPCLDQAAPWRDATTKWDPSGRTDDAGLGLQCGNYYFAPDADELERIFLEIAGRIFTRISG